MLRDPLIFPYSKAGRLLHNVGRPICHQAAAPLEQIGPRVTPLDVGSNGVRQGVFAHRVRVVGLFARPRAQRRAEPVDGRCPFQAGEFQTAQQGSAPEGDRPTVFGTVSRLGWPPERRGYALAWLLSPRKEHWRDASAGKKAHE